MPLFAAITLAVAACSLENPLNGDDSAVVDGDEASVDGDETGDETGDGSGPSTGEDAETVPPIDPSPESGADRPVEPLVEPDEATVQQVADLPGRLAITSGLRLAVNEPGGVELQVLDDGIESSASQPVWSDDGARLVWSRLGANGHEVVVTDIAVGTDVVTPLAGPPAFYFQWSADGETVAYLRNAQDRRGVELGLVIPGAETVTVGVAAPFFIHWSPGPEASLAAHIGGARVVEVNDPGLAFEGGVEEPTVLLEPTAFFSTPTWIDERTVMAAGSDGLVLIDVETLQTETIVGFDGTGRQVRFVVSPDRTKVAYQLDRGTGAPAVASYPGNEQQRQDQPVGGPVPVSLGSATATAAAEAARSAVPATVDAESGLVVVDLATETSEVVTADTALRWEWSPTSDRLAWLEPIPSTTDPLVRWNFWTDAETPVVVTPVHRLTDVVAQAYLPFFEQYVHSVTGWSPNGLAFAFAGRHEAEPPTAVDSVWVQLIAAETPPVRVAEGDVVAWSP